MGGYSFGRKSDINTVLKWIRDPQSFSRRETARIQRLVRVTETMIFETPAGGIGGISGSTAGTADCTPYYLDNNGVLQELTDDDDASQTIEVYHIGTSAIAENTKIMATFVYDKLIANWEDCA